eukprot:SAG11_NODE_133_length_15400_cov_10.132344_13_plen_152_part_00
MPVCLCISACLSLYVSVSLCRSISLSLWYVGRLIAAAAADCAAPEGFVGIENISTKEECQQAWNDLVSKSQMHASIDDIKRTADPLVVQTDHLEDAPAGCYFVQVRGLSVRLRAERSGVGMGGRGAQREEQREQRMGAQRSAAGLHEGRAR